jgi:hypothetical protein
MTDETKWLAFSVDLEPNKDDTLDGVEEAMAWFDRTVPRGTVYATHRIATALPGVVADLAVDNEIAVHVHPREFGHDHDQLAELPPDRQRELIRTTRTALAEAASINPEDVVSFRAGRHSASEATLDVLADLGFEVDASVNVRYTDYLPSSLTRAREPFSLENGLLEVPTSYYRPSIFSRVGLRVFPQRELTATASSLRADSPVCSGLLSMRALFSAVDEGVSMYMHPYDATDHHADLENGGATFRRRVGELLAETGPGWRYVSANDLRE